MENKNTHVYSHKGNYRRKAWVDSQNYEKMYQRSVQDPENFWREKALRLDWITPFTKVENASYEQGNISIRWFEDGTLNACYNCLDRHLSANGNKIALLWEGNRKGENKSLTYRQLYDEVCCFANALRRQGLKKGDRICIYMPMIPEAVVAMLACTRIGAVHSVVFAGFSAEALRDRIEDCQAACVITSDKAARGERFFSLKEQADKALKGNESVKTVFVARRTDHADVSMIPGRDLWYHQEIIKEEPHCPPEEMGAEDPLFILYTSGSTGQPKGVLHTTGGYLVYAAFTHKYIFDYHPEDIYWCTADIGWITGHTYSVYGPLLNNASTVIFEGIPYYPTAQRIWDVVDKYEVNSLYTAPTVVRMLKKEGNEFVHATSRRSLRVLGSVGEPINQEAWEWYYHVVGEGSCPIVDTWWQTETGGILITPLPGVTDLKPGSATRPFFGVQPVLLNEAGEEIEGEGEGFLCLANSWPGQMRTLYKNHERFEETYFSRFPGYYFSGDGARRDADGDYWITGRVDDVINIAGKRLGTAEVEDAINSVPIVNESAVVGIPHDVKGETIYAYFSLQTGVNYEESILDEIKTMIRSKIGAFALPQTFQFAENLPRTRSGKIMRRILRKIAHGQYKELGDISTLSEPAVVELLIENHKRLSKES